jgi:GH43 family beta-xylosidase
MRYIICIGLLLSLGSCHRSAYLFTSFREPAHEGLRMLYSRDAMHWKRIDTILLKPAIGLQRVMRDPSMVQGPDGVFHLVWTTSWRGDKGFGYASSRDLIHWSEQRMIPVMQHEPTTVNVWAPEIHYDQDSARFVIIWASCIPGRFERGIEDDSNNHRMYVTTTKDFNTFTPTKLFLDPGFSVIDAVIVKRDAQDYRLVLKDNTRPERNLRVAEGDAFLGPWKSVSKPFTGKFTEGPTVVQRKGWWYIYFDAYQDKRYDVIRTKDFVTFEDVTSRTSIPEGHKHGTILKVDRRVLKQLLKATNK